MISKIKKTIGNYSIFCRGDRVLVGLSGGPDSVCLLSVIMKLAPIFKLKIYIAHLNHGFRGNESDADQKFCEDLGKKWGIPVYTGKVKIKKSEDAARNARYEFLEKIAKKIRATKIALGHNADDQAETVLMRLLRGAGAKGLGGIPPVRMHGDYFIVRPLIDVWRYEILNYLEKKNINYRIDRSNKKLIYFRNKVRNELIPFLSKYNPNIKNVLQNTGKNMAMVNEYLEDIINREFSGNSINISRLKRLHPVISQELLRRTAESVEVNLDAGHISNIMALASEKKGSKALCLPKGIKAIREYDRLIFCRSKKDKGDIKEKLSIPGKIKILEHNILVSSELCKIPKKIKRNPFEVFLDYDKISHPLIVRSRRPGDVFQPIGFKSKKKVKGIFIDLKIPERIRDSIPLFVSGNDICWVPGYRIGEKFKIGEDTKRAVRISVKGVDSLWQIQALE